jgi:hypothetical protein
MSIPSHFKQIIKIVRLKNDRYSILGQVLKPNRKGRGRE